MITLGDARRLSQISYRVLPLVSLVVMLAACTPGVVQENNRGNRLFAQGDYAAALEAYRQAQLDDPDRAEPYYNAANAHSRQTAVDAAVSQAQQALKTADMELAAWTWYNLGNVFFDAERWGEAIAAYQKALRIDPTDLDAKVNLELALKHLQDQQRQGVQERQDAPSPQGNEQPQEDQEASTPAGQSIESEERAQEAPAGLEQPEETERMTPEQAQRMLQAIVNEGETLGERLQHRLVVPLPAPEKDW